MFRNRLRKYLFILSFLPFLTAAGCAQLEAQRNQLAAQDEAIRKLRDENRQFQDAYYKIKEQLDSQGSQSQKNVEKLTHDLDQTRTQRSQVERDLTTRIQNINTTLTKAQSGFQEEKLKLQTQIAQLQQNVQILTAERNAAFTREKDAETTLTAEQARTANLTRQVAQLTAGTKTLGDQAAGLKKAVADRDTALQTAQGSRQAAEKQAAEQGTQLAELNKNYQAAQARLTEQSRQLAELNKNYQAAQARQAEQAKQLQEARATLTSQGGQLKEAQSQSQQMSRRGSAATAELEQLRKDKAELTAQLAAARARQEKDLNAAKAVNGGAGTASGEDSELKQQAEELRQKIRGITVKMDGRGLHLIVPNALLFDENKTILADRAASVLEPIAEALNAMGSRPVQVEGHTDNKMVPDLPYADLWGLGLAHADRVREYLMKDGKVDGSRLTALSRAQFEPLASNDTPEGRKQNRRVEIVVGKK